ncbi:MAG: PhzF family phenazine biosynthesis protein [bacterium]|nr:MAG: PhzF family phenazine biosynthesis protein [bacterium]
MRSIEVKKIDVFTMKPFCGNPAGIITMGDGLTTEDMHRIAAELNLAECAFVMSPNSSKSAFRVRFFTQCVELDLSSHALIAACFGVIEDRRLPLHHGITSIQFDTRIGSVPLDIYIDVKDESTDNIMSTDGVHITCADGNSGILRRMMIHQKRDNIQRADIPVPDLANILGVDKQEILGTGLPLEILTYGLRQLVIPMMHQEILLNLKPDLIKLNLLNQQYDIQTNDIFTLEPVSQDATAFSRTFSPSIGLWEDVGSGSGTGSIAAYLIRHAVLVPGPMIIEQGNERDRLARIFIEVGEPQGLNIPLTVGGLAVTSIVQNLKYDAGTVTML